MGSVGGGEGERRCEDRWVEKDVFVCGLEKCKGGYYGEVYFNGLIGLRKGETVGWKVNEIEICM